ncbi:MAG: hypothetical protein KDD99_32680, partial [Bacteroidetes bacterium]|nr:hypothetical protein [Bacteroidota bacterium]
MEKRIIIVVLLWSSSVAVFAQETINQEIKVTSVSQLDFLIGTWKGEGWKMDQNRQRVTFTQTETIVPKVENSIL